MNRQEWKIEQKKALTATLEEERNNPIFLLSTVATDLVSRIAKGEVNVQEIAKRTLEGQGLDINGNWVGFGKGID